ncbi:MAG: translation initiation factor IF-2 [Candidatus Tokpelaia sp. JSC188]|nr:MAG: translation initiation factor IF-2 [Candidatus Tokpelaia sp. JSC188]
MSDKKNEDKTSSVSHKKTLTLKRSSVEHSMVKQNFSHGRVKAVVVETKRRKITRPNDKVELSTVQPVTKPRVAIHPKAHKETPPPKIAQKVSNLSSIEMKARLKALKDENIRLEQERSRMEEDIKQRSTEKVECEKKHQEVLKRRIKENVRQKKEARKYKEIKAPSNIPLIKDKKATVQDGGKQRALSQTSHWREKNKEEIHSIGLRRSNAAASAKQEVRAPKVIKGSEERRRSKLTLSSALDDDNTNFRGRSIAAMRRRQEKFKRTQVQEIREKISREVTIPETITIQELAQRMTERAVDVIKFLMKQGQMMKPGDIIDGDMAQLISEEFGHTVKRVAESDVELGIFSLPDDESKMRLRPPVVTIMGHVDHGKTSLLDAIRKANVVSEEAGGITQHIGAYQVEQSGQKITFIDTPGHAAFTAMRARGAQVTDVAVLVVSADDSVMPQTIESINHAKAANVPIIVAINKIDKPAANSQKVRTELSLHEVLVESLGGEVLEVEVSAKTGKNIDKLLEAILLQAEILDIKADPERAVEGVVIEAKLDRGCGSVATVLVQKGTLYPGDIIVAGDEWGRVRALINERGEHMKEAGPSTPVEILGMQGTPRAGDCFAAVSSESQAREISEYRRRLSREKAIARQAGSRGSLEQMISQLQTSGSKEFPLIIKGDVQGSVEAINAVLEKLGNDEVCVRIVHAAAGGITESDVSLAAASKATIIGFNVRANKQARDVIETQGIEIRYYNIIYDLVNDIKAVMSGMLTPERRETFLGTAQILEVFNISKVGKVSGCRVIEGKIERGAGVRLIRDNIVIHEGKLKTLKRFKDEVNEVSIGQECGMAFENHEDIRASDIIEAFRVEHVSRTL